MRIRQVKPEFFLDDSLASSCTRDARLLFIGLWTLADREGRLEDRPAKIKAQIFPFDDDISVSEMVSFIDQLAAEGCISRYEVDGKRLLWIRNFLKHQHCHHKEQPSQLPPIKEDNKKPRASLGQAPDLPPTSPSASTSTSTSTYGLRHTASGRAASQPPRAKKGLRASQRTGAPGLFEISESLKEWASKACPNLCIDEETEKFLDHHRAVGSSFRDWDAAWRKWMRNAAEWGHARVNGAKTKKSDIYDKLNRMIEECESEDAKKPTGR